MHSYRFLLLMGAAVLARPRVLPSNHTSSPHLETHLEAHLEAELEADLATLEGLLQPPVPVNIAALYRTQCRCSSYNNTSFCLPPLSIAASLPSTKPVSNATCMPNATSNANTSTVLHEREGIACHSRPDGPGPVAIPDTVRNFYNLGAIKTASREALTPPG